MDYLLFVKDILYVQITVIHLLHRTLPVIILTGRMKCITLNLEQRSLTTTFSVGNTIEFFWIYVIILEMLNMKFHLHKPLLRHQRGMI